MHHKAVIADSEWRMTGCEGTIETTLQRGLVSSSCPWLGVRLVPLRDLTQIVPDIVLCTMRGLDISAGCLTSLRKRTFVQGSSATPESSPMTRTPPRRSERSEERGAEYAAVRRIRQS